MNQSAATQIVQPERGLITVAHIMPAPGPGKSARIKDTDGMMFGIWPDKLANVVIGSAYEIEFTAKVSNGVTYRDIKAIRLAERPGPAPDQFTGGRPQQAVEPTRQVPPNYRQATPPHESEQMFVCNILGRFIQTGRIDCQRDSLALAIKEIRAGFRGGFSNE
jgi:hypothetical protein